MKPIIGDIVTCRTQVEAYGSNYGLSKGLKIWFMPGMLAVVTSIAPKVTLTPAVVDLYDRKADFLVCSYKDCNDRTQRVGLNYCNAVFVKRIK